MTDDATMNVVEMVLVGSVNKDIVNQINRAGARAVGLSGKDGMLLHAEKKAMVVTRENQPPEIIDLGNVGRVTRVETTLIFSLMKDGFVPVIAPVGVDDEGHTYNINADAVAGAVAGALRARRLIMLTDVAGVLDPEGKLIQSGIRSKTAGTIQSYEFEFSVRDPELARRLMLEGGRSVELHYKEYFGALPWRGFTKFVVDSVVSSSPAPSRQGAAPAPGAGLSEL